MNDGERAWTIDEIPLERCFQPGVKLDFRHFADGYVATAADVEAELKRIGHTLQPLDIVLVNTGAGVKSGQPDYSLGLRHGRGGDALSARARRARDRHRRLELGRALRPYREEYAQTHDASIIWEGHKAGRHIGYCHIEKLHNLEALPSTGFSVCCFPRRSNAPRPAGRALSRLSKPARRFGRKRTKLTLNARYRRKADIAGRESGRRDRADAYRRRLGNDRSWRQGRIP